MHNLFLEFCYRTCFQPNFAVSQKNFYELRINSNQPYTLRLILKPQLNAAAMIKMIPPNVYGLVPKPPVWGSVIVILSFRIVPPSPTDAQFRRTD